jgi:hypothetical protein
MVNVAQRDAAARIRGAAFDRGRNDVAGAHVGQDRAAISLAGGLRQRCLASRGCLPIF